MGKTNDLITTLEEMMSCGNDMVKAARELYSSGELLIRLAGQLRDEFTETAAGEPAQEASGDGSADPAAVQSTLPAAAVQADAQSSSAPTIEETDTNNEQKVYKMEDVRTILARKSRDGFREEVKALLLKYGADRLSQIDAQYYAALVADAEALGHAG